MKPKTKINEINKKIVNDSSLKNALNNYVQNGLESFFDLNANINYENVKNMAKKMIILLFSKE